MISGSAKNKIPVHWHLFRTSNNDTIVILVGGLQYSFTDIKGYIKDVSLYEDTVLSVRDTIIKGSHGLLNPMFYYATRVVIPPLSAITNKKTGLVDYVIIKHIGTCRQLTPLR